MNDTIDNFARRKLKAELDLWELEEYLSKNGHGTMDEIKKKADEWNKSSNEDLIAKANFGPGSFNEFVRTHLSPEDLIEFNSPLLPSPSDMHALDSRPTPTRPNSTSIPKVALPLTVNHDGSKTLVLNSWNQRPIKITTKTISQ